MKSKIIGPWKVGKCDASTRDVAFWHVDVLNKDRTLRIARVSGVGEKMARTNANLIAAAPDMLDMLKTIENDAGQVPAWLWERIQAVIAKAEKEDPNNENNNH